MKKLILKIKFKIYIVIYILLISICVLIYNNNGFPSRFNGELLNILNIKALGDFDRGDNICNLGGYSSAKLLGCVRGDIRVKPNYALIGDSHAASISKELNIAFNNYNKSFIQYTKNGCPFSDNYYSVIDLHCKEFIANVLNDIRKRNIKNLIIFNRWTYYIKGSYDNGIGGKEYDINRYISTNDNSILLNSLNLINELITQGKNIIIIDPLPEHGWDIPTMYFRRMVMGDENNIIMERNYYLSRNFEYFTLINKLNIKRVKTGEIFCQEKKCITRIDNHILYYDDDHPSKYGAKLIIQELIKLIHE